MSDSVRQLLKEVVEKKCPVTNLLLNVYVPVISNGYRQENADLQREVFHIKN